MLTGKRIAIIGSGNHGTRPGGGFRSGKVEAMQLACTARTRPTAERLSSELGLQCTTDNSEAARGADIVVLCLKPKDVAKACEGMKAKGALGHAPLVVSIAAGVSTGPSRRCSGRAFRSFVRCRTPPASSAGDDRRLEGAHATDDHAAVALDIFSTMGRTMELEEKHMDTVTALSASGPAFIYVVLESLADGGVMRGLPRAAAIELAAQAALGAAEMVLQTGRHPAALKDDVTTPAGCTIAGILAMEDGRIRSVLARGIETAARAAGELGK
ncbi:MAG: NAD(P)-binding domain-containing protein [Holophagales bacterium]|nr:NAD(P)-binding domain-containing protein [Holophagales bacterium]